MRTCSSFPPPWVYVERTPEGGWYVDVCCVVWRPSEQMPAEAWGNLSFRLENGLLVLLWSGIGCFQLQIGYCFNGAITWSDAGPPREGPAEISVSDVEAGSPRYFRVVPCNEESPEEPE